MNLDNQRLREIQELKHCYGLELDKSETINDCILIQGYIEELEREEKEILSRGGVSIG